MKTDRNCGMPPYPVYPNMPGGPMMGQPMMNQPMMGQMMDDSMCSLQQELTNLNKRVEQLERRCSKIENMITQKQPFKSQFNDSNFQII